MIPHCLHRMESTINTENSNPNMHCRCERPFINILHISQFPSKHTQLNSVNCDHFIGKITLYCIYLKYHHKPHISVHHSDHHQSSQRVCPLTHTSVGSRAGLWHTGKTGSTFPDMLLLSLISHILTLFCNSSAARTFTLFQIIQFFTIYINPTALFVAGGM